MLLKPTVPLGPDTVKETIVVVFDWYGVMVTFDICCAVTFPLISKGYVSPVVVTVAVNVSVAKPAVIECEF
jgi:hypothetical protein